MAELKRQYNDLLDAKMEALSNGDSEAVMEYENKLRAVFRQMLKTGLLK